MNEPKKLLRSDIRYECRDSSCEQGRSYFEKGLLVNLTIKEEKIIAMQERKCALAESIYKDLAKEESLKLTAEDLTALFEPL